MRLVAGLLLLVGFSALAFDRPPSRPAPTLTLTASPTTVAKGQETIVSWSSTNASLCEAKLGAVTAAVSLSGSVHYVFPATSTLSMTCSGTGGSVMRSVTITVCEGGVVMGLIMVCSVSGTGTDTTPNQFTFTDQTGVGLSSTITSAAITVSGINAAATISVTGGTYDKNASGSFTSSAGTVVNGDTIRARHTSSGSNSTATNTVITIGGVSDTFTSTTEAAVSGSLLFQDKFTDRSTGNVSMTSAWTNKGYTGVTATTSGNVQVYARASLPSGLTGDSNFPASKSRVFVAYIPNNEDEARVTNESGLPANTREAWYSWWEYRDNTNVGGEKWLRVGNRVSVGGSRGHDIIWCFGANRTSLTLIANSSNMYPYGDHEFDFPSGWLPGMDHFEVGIHLSDSTSSNGWTQVWQNGVLIADVQGLRFNQDATQASRDLDLFEIGGWSSGLANPQVRRYIPEFRVYSARQGVWAITDE